MENPLTDILKIQKVIHPNNTIVHGLCMQGEKQYDSDKSLQVDFFCKTTKIHEK